MRAIVFLPAFLLTACGAGVGPACSEGYVEVDGECVDEDELGTGDTGTADDTGDTEDDTDTGGETGDTDTGGETGDTGTAAATVRDVQEGATGLVTLEYVVVTTGVSTDGSTFFVQDAGGGAWSGVKVFVADYTAVASVGQVVTITGEALEYYDETEISVSAAADVEAGGAGDAVADVLTEAPADWEMYEGVLVTLVDVTVEEEADEYGEAPTSWGLNVDDLLFAWYDTAPSGSSFSELTGVVQYTFGAYKITPRGEGDFVP